MREPRKFTSRRSSETVRIDGRRRGWRKRSALRELRPRVLGSPHDEAADAVAARGVRAGLREALRVEWRVSFGRICGHRSSNWWAPTVGRSFCTIARASTVGRGQTQGVLPARWQRAAARPTNRRWPDPGSPIAPQGERVALFQRNRAQHGPRSFSNLLRPQSATVNPASASSAIPASAQIGGGRWSERMDMVRFGRSSFRF
jgi:hypothetical protein